MKISTLIISLLIVSSNMIFGQENKTIALTTSGQGANKDESKQKALRNAIEQAFGTFISSKTEILNDQITTDDLVSISNGNIQSFEVLSETQLPNNEWSTTVKSVVSITNLTSFCENKGISVEFKGSLFAFNINQQLSNEKNEVIAVENMCRILSDISDISFDFSIKASNPVSSDQSNSKWRIPIEISVYKNKNFENIQNVLFSTLQGLSLSQQEAENYLALNKKVFPVTFASDENKYGYFVLRTDASILKLQELLYHFNHSLQNFKITNGVNEFRLNDYKQNISHIYDGGFRVFVKNENCFASVFYTGIGSNQCCTEGCVKSNNRNSCGFSLDFKQSQQDMLREKYYLDHIVMNQLYIGNNRDKPNEEVWEQNFNNHFSFVKQLKSKMIKTTSGYRYAGLIISLIPQVYKPYPEEFDEKTFELAQEKQNEIMNISVPNISVKIQGQKIDIEGAKLAQQFMNAASLNINWDSSEWGKEFTELLNKKDKEILAEMNQAYLIKYNEINKKYLQKAKPLVEDDNNEIVRYYFNDQRTLDEINRISEYKIIPLKN